MIVFTYAYIRTDSLRVERTFFFMTREQREVLYMIAVMMSYMVASTAWRREHAVERLRERESERESGRAVGPCCLCAVWCCTSFGIRIRIRHPAASTTKNSATTVRDTHKKTGSGSAGSCPWRISKPPGIVESAPRTHRCTSQVLSPA